MASLLIYSKAKIIKQIKQLTYLSANFNEVTRDIQNKVGDTAD